MQFETAMINLDLHAAVKAANDDWADDAKGQDHLDKSRLMQCWFQLADIYTDGVNAFVYAEFTEKLNSIASQGQPRLTPRDGSGMTTP